jgi:hypothetical protein
MLSGLSAGRRGDIAMARTYREIAIEEMLRTVEEAMSQVIDWWGDLPPPMKEAIEQFRTQLGAAIDSVEFVKRALDREIHETDRGEGPASKIDRSMPIDAETEEIPNRGNFY